HLGVSLTCLMTTGAYVVFALWPSFPGLCLGSALAGAAYGLGGMTGASLLVGRWFKHGVGTALGVAAMGSSVAALILPLISTHLVQAYSLATAFWSLAALAGAISLIIILLLRNRPQALGSGATSEHASALGHKAPAQHRFGDNSSLTPGHYALLLAACVLIGMACVGGNSFLAVLLSTHGFDAGFIAYLLSFTGIMAAAGKFAMGRIFDSWGTGKGTMLFFCFSVVGFVMVTLGAPLGSALLIVGGCLLGYLGVSLDTVGVSRWSLELATSDGRAKTIKDLQLFIMAGTIVGNLIPGLIMDALGSYVYSYVIFTACMLAAAVMLLVVLGVSVPLRHRVRANRG
ncbi:MAG: MFS transporter, partial [Coriobacteriales bacterium]|nr:MFS transporter [Coriobacteriales bacterium]